MNQTLSSYTKAMPEILIGYLMIFPQQFASKVDENKLLNRLQFTSH